MLTITIPERELYDEKQEVFIILPAVSIDLEHSLAAMSKWESTWCKPFLGKDAKTDEETLDYVRCMSLSGDVSPEVCKRITRPVLDQINAYIAAPMTATTFMERNQPRDGEVITNEVVYYWMATFQIPFTCETWHLNRLLTLIRVANIKNSPQKKMSRQDITSQNRSLNAKRRAAMKSKG